MWTSRLVALAACAALAAAAPAAVAQDGAAGLLASGEKSIADGKHALAVQQLSRALRSENLSSAEIAQAFYQRGIAHRELGQHAQAIADFTNALWIKELPDSVLKQVEASRAQSYAALGRPEGEGIAVARAPSPANAAVGAFETRVQATERPATTREDTQVASAPTARVEPAAARTRPAPEPVPQFRTSVVEETPPPAEPVTTAAISPRAQPSAPPPASWSTSVAPEQRAQPAAATSTAPTEEPQEQGSRVGRFFSNLRGSIFGDDDAGTASAAEGEASAAAVPTTQWSASTTVATSEPAGAAEAGGRSYRLQLASVRSEEDAQAVWQQISTKHQDLVDGREPTIEKTDLGALGTVYRVQIGPFADKRETLQLCNAFKAGGVDCFLVTR